MANHLTVLEQLRRAAAAGCLGLQPVLAAPLEGRPGLPATPAAAGGHALVWATRLGELADGALGAEELHEWVQEAAAHAHSWGLHDRRAQQENWRDFLQDASSGGAGLLHRLTKPAPVVRPPLPGLQPASRADPLQGGC